MNKSNLYEFAQPKALLKPRKFGSSNYNRNHNQSFYPPGNPGKGDWVPPPRINEELYNSQFTEDLREREKFDSDMEYVMDTEWNDPDSVRLSLTSPLISI